MLTPIPVDQQNGNTLYRGPRPMSLSDFQMLNCSTVIDLEAGWFDFFSGRQFEEDGWGSQLAVNVRHIPLSDFFVPSEAQTRAFIIAVKAGLLRGNVYVHCLHGVDRTGFMCAQWRIRIQGWSPDRAIAEMLNLGFHKIPYYFWINSLKFQAGT